MKTAGSLKFFQKFHMQFQKTTVEGNSETTDNDKPSTTETPTEFEVTVFVFRKDIWDRLNTHVSRNVLQISINPM